MKLVIRFFKESSDQWTLLILLVLSLIGASIFEVAAPMLLGQIVDAVVLGLQSHSNMTYILHGVNTVILILVALYTGHSLCTYSSEYIMAGVSQKMVLALRNRLSQHLYRLPMSYFTHHRRGDLLSRLTSDLDNVAETLQEGLPGLVSSVIGIVGAMAMMIYISPFLASIIIGVILIGKGGLYYMSNRAQRIYLKNQENLGAFNSGIEELVSGKSIIQAFSLETVTTNSLNVLNNELFYSIRQAGFMGRLIMPLVNFLNQIGYILVAIQGGILVLRGAITLGDVQAFFLYVTQISDPISRTSYILTKLQETVSALHRIYDVLDTPPEHNTTSKSPTHFGTNGTIQFNDVSFGYTADTIVMKHISFTIPGGSRVAIVGPTGAGKTTLVNLIMRFYEIESGSITIDDVDIRNISRHALYNKVSMVLQDAWIFTGTIADNIAYAKPGATRQEIVQVAKLAMADHFIRTLPNGYDTVLRNGASDLSHGQRQLITICRAFLANPSILILDEATANVDTRTEVEVQRAMSQLLKGRTGIIIAHRLSTIRDADFLLVVDNFTIVEQGTHEELLHQNGYYRKLYENYARGMSL